MARRKSTKSARRAVIVGGIRTPFVKAFAEYTRLDTIALGVQAVNALLEQTGLDRREVQCVRWGGVILPPTAPNVGREIVFDAGLPVTAEAFTLSRACASGLQAVTEAAAAITRGECDVAIAGGSDSTTNATVAMPSSFVQKVGPVALSSKSGPADYFRLLGQLNPARDLLPAQPRIAERSTGELMGESAEKMAVRNEISRAAQDAFAAQSHHRAAAAQESGRFAEELCVVETPDGKRVHADTIVRATTSAEKLAKLRPAFAKGGTLTAGNSSALTDGAAAVLLMSEEKAKALGFTPKAAITSWAYVGVDPADQLLMGPALSIPLALERAGLSLKDVDLVDIHEAFAAQVLSVLKMLGSKAFAEHRLGRSEAVGELAPEDVNVHGGSIALGHPFGATGARMVTTMANELHLRGGGKAVLGLCAAGGLGASAVLEAV